MKPARSKAVQDAQRASDASQKAHADYRDTAAANAHDYTADIHHQVRNGGNLAKKANAADDALAKQAAANKVLSDQNKATRAKKGI
jgi:hypothetical protein